jgi:hypothetical protein
MPKRKPVKKAAEKGFNISFFDVKPKKKAPRPTSSWWGSTSEAASKPKKPAKKR